MDDIEVRARAVMEMPQLLYVVPYAGIWCYSLAKAAVRRIESIANEAELAMLNARLVELANALAAFIETGGQIQKRFKGERMATC